MQPADGVLWVFLIMGAVIAYAAWRMDSPYKESFINLGGGLGGVSLATLSTQALDSAPSTSEVKQHYKTLLVFADADIRKQGTKGLRILADFRDRLFGTRDFRDNLVVDDFLADWPAWIPPLDTTIKEPIPDSSSAVTAESQLLAYLQKNYPQEGLVDEQTGSTVRNIIEDFGYRFVFKKGIETTQLKDDFLRKPLLTNWTNPAARV